jgi:spermidine synthase
MQPLLFGLFFLSGMAALIYQTAWHRLLGLFAGADSIAAALVVGAFLLGLGVGSLAAGLLADRLSRRAALVAFALCEVGIAAFAAISPWLYYDIVYRELLPISSSRAVVFCVVFAGLLWPTFLMGCSLPFLSKAVVRKIEGSARLIGLLYGVNTLGAGVGAFVGGWLLIGTLGFATTIEIGAVLNLVVAAGGLLLASRMNLRSEAAGERVAAASPGDQGLVWRWAFLVFVSGFLIVALQIVWYRLIGVLLQSNGYSFSLVLAVFLLGDAAGLLVGARFIGRIADPRRFFFLMQGTATALALAGAWFVHLAIGWGVLPSTFVDRDIMGPGTAQPALIAFLLAVVVLPASFTMGFSFPVVQKAVQQDLDRLGSRVGYVQLANIVGNSAGSLVAGLLLLDLFGTPGTLRLLVAIGLVFALLQFWGPRVTRRSSAPASGLGSFVPAALLAAGLLLFPGGEGFWRRLHGIAAEPAIVAEDKTGLSVLKLADKSSGKLYIQGHSQSSLPFHTVHVFLGVIGPLTHDAPRQVLVIGSGTGGTPYAAGAHPATARVKVIEIVAPVVDTLRRFVESGGTSGIDGLLGDRKFEVRVADGRHELALDKVRYDVIEADAILPKTALSGLLNSQEFFQQVRARLAPGGIYIQWAPTERSVDTFRSVFPYVTMVHPLRARQDPGAAAAAGDRRPSRTGARRPAGAQEVVRREEDRAAERGNDHPGQGAQHRLLSARRVLPQSPLKSVLGVGLLEVPGDVGPVQQPPDAVGGIEAAVELEADLRRVAQARLFADPGAKPRRGAAHGAEQALLVLAAQRHDEGDGIAQVGADVDRGHGDRGAAQLGVAHLAALDQGGQDVTHLFADAQLALAVAAAFTVGRRGGGVTTGHRGSLFLPFADAARGRCRRHAATERSRATGRRLMPAPPPHTGAPPLADPDKGRDYTQRVGLTSSMSKHSITSPTLMSS